MSTINNKCSAVCDQNTFLPDLCVPQTSAKGQKRIGVSFSGVSNDVGEGCIRAGIDGYREPHGNMQFGVDVEGHSVCQGEIGDGEYVKVVEEMGSSASMVDNSKKLASKVQQKGTVAQHVVLRPDDNTHPNSARIALQNLNINSHSSRCVSQLVEEIESLRELLGAVAEHVEQKEEELSMAEDQRNIFEARAVQAEQQLSDEKKRVEQIIIDYEAVIRMKNRDLKFATRVNDRLMNRCRQQAKVNSSEQLFADEIYVAKDTLYSPIAQDEVKTYKSRHKVRKESDSSYHTKRKKRFSKDHKKKRQSTADDISDTYPSIDQLPKTTWGKFAEYSVPESQKEEVSDTYRSSYSPMYDVEQAQQEIAEEKNHEDDAELSETMSLSSANTSDSIRITRGLFRIDSRIPIRQCFTSGKAGDGNVCTSLAKPISGTERNQKTESIKKERRNSKANRMSYAERRINASQVQESCEQLLQESEEVLKGITQPRRKNPEISSKNLDSSTSE